MNIKIRDDGKQKYQSVEGVLKIQKDYWMPDGYVDSFSITAFGENEKECIDNLKILHKELLSILQKIDIDSLPKVEGKI